LELGKTHSCRPFEQALTMEQEYLQKVYAWLSADHGRTYAARRE
jgi:hypothetical protein